MDISKQVNGLSYKTIFLVFGLIFLAIGLNAFYKGVYEEDCIGLCTVNMSASYANEGRTLKGAGRPTYNQALKNMRAKEGKFTAKNNKVFVVDYNTGFSLQSSKIFGAKVNEIKGAAIKGDIVVINITSPGGSALACASDYNKVVSLKQRGIKVVATIDYAALSCGYYLASGADLIIADSEAWVGNIGAVVSLPKPKKGSEKIVIGSTKTKELLAGRTPSSDEDVAIFKEVVAMSFNSFKNSVINGRGNRLDKKDYGVVFSALPFSGNRGVELGLVDNIATSHDFLQSLYYSGFPIVKIVYNQKKTLIQKLVTGESQVLSVE